MDWMTLLLAPAVLGGLGLLFGVILNIAGNKLALDPEQRVEDVRAALCGYNCGACGCAGCDAFARNLTDGRAKPEDCPMSDPDAVARALEGR